MNITSQPNRQGYTFIPDYNEVTGEIDIEGGSIAPTNMKNWVASEDLNFDGQDPTSYEEVEPLTEEELIDADLDYQAEEVSPTELSDITDEVLGLNTDFDEAQASAVLEAPMGNTPGDVTIQYLAHQYYTGNMSAEEAYNEALNSGLPPEVLAKSYRKLQSYFQ